MISRRTFCLAVVAIPFTKPSALKTTTISRLVCHIDRSAISRALDSMQAALRGASDDVRRAAVAALESSDNIVEFTCEGSTTVARPSRVFNARSGEERGRRSTQPNRVGTVVIWGWAVRFWAPAEP